MTSENWQNEAYLYDNYNVIWNTHGARLRQVPSYCKTHFYTRLATYSPSEQTAYSFMRDAKETDSISDIDDIFKAKLGLSEDTIGLTIGQIKSREHLQHDNLARIYDDLFRVDQFRSEISFPQYYLKDNAWSDLNNQELKLREQIRRELKDSVRDLSFLQNDLRNGLVEWKNQNSKSAMLGDIGGGDTLDEILGPIEPERNYKNKPGDTYGNQTHT